MLSTLVISATLIGCQKATLESRISEAERLIESGQAESAIIVLKNAIQEKPDSKELRDLLGHTLFKKGDLAGAEKEFTKSENVQMSLLSKFYQGKYEDVLLDVKKISDPLSDNELVIDFISKQRLGVLENKTEVISLEELSTESQELIAAYSSLAEGNDEPLLTLIQGNASNYEFLSEELTIVLSQIQRGRGEYKNALDTIENLAKRWERNARVAYLYVDLLLRNQKYETAASKIMPWLVQNENNPWANLAQASIEVHNENFKKALFHSQKAIQFGIDNAQTNAFAGAIALKAQNNELAYQFLNKANERAPGNIPVMQQLAEVQLKLGYTDRATKLLNELSRRQESNVDFLVSATKYLASQGKTEQSEVLVNSLDRNKSNDTRALEFVAAFELEAGKNAIPTLEKLLTIDENSIGAYMMLFQSYLESNDTQQAKLIINKVKLIDEIESKLMQALLFLREKEYNEAILECEQVLADTDHIGALRIASLAAVRAGQLNKAFEYTVKLYELSPDKKSIAKELLSLASITFDDTNVEELLRENFFNGALPTPIKEEFALKRVQEKQFKEAMLLLEGNDGLSDDGRVTLVNSLLALGMNAEATEHVANWMRRDPNSSRAKLVNVSVLEYLQDYDAIISFINALSESEKRDSRYGMILFNAYIQAGQPDKAEIAISMLKEAGVEQSVLLNYGGQRALAMGQLNSAKEQLLGAYNSKKSYGYAIFLAKVYASAGEPKRGANVLLEVARLNDNLSRLEMHSIAEYLSQFELLEDAESIYAKIIEKLNSDHMALNNLANVQLKARKLNEAKKNALLAIREQESTHYYHTLGDIELLSGNINAARAAYNTALELDPKNDDAIQSLKRLNEK